MDSSVMPMAPVSSYFFYNPEQTDARRHGNFVPQNMHIQQQQPGQAQYYYAAMPLTPAYSRPSSSSSQHQQPVLMSQKQSPFPGAAMHYMLPATPRSVSVASNGKPAIMLETDFAGDVQPATPTLSSSTSTASSTIGSPSANDTVLSSSMNPMFSCFDNSKDVAGDAMIEHYNAALACNSPPYTPVFIQAPSQTAQPAQTRSAPSSLSTDLLTVSACPSLSSSPAPFAEQDNDFCDPRNLTFCGSEGSVSPTFSTVQVSASPVADAEEDFVLSSESATIAPSATESVIAAPAAVNDFAPHGLPILEEFPELEGDDEFVNLVNLGAEFSSHSSIAATPELSNRSRASSSVTTHSEPLEFFAESWESSFESNVSEQSCKRQRTSSVSFVTMNAATSVEVADASASAAGSPEQASEAHNTACNNDNSVMSSSSESSASPEADSGSIEGGATAPMPTNRRGRKQSLTEDPSKIFACDLCNRRFRRQEHLKRHYRSLHTQDKPFNCHECGKKFSRSDNLAQHARTHGAGALVMNVFDDPDLVAAANGGFMPHMMYQNQGMAMNDDYTNMGRVLFQVASEIPGSSSDLSEDSDAQGKKKRKRME